MRVKTTGHAVAHPCNAGRPACEQSSMRALAAGVVVAVSGLGLTASAGAGWGGQPPAKQTVAEQRTQDAKAALEKAINDSKAASKPLLVMFGTDPGRVKLNEQVLAVPATAGWVARHAMTHMVTDGALIKALSELQFFKPGANGGPPVADPSRRLVQTAGGDPLLYTDGLIELLDKRSSILLPNSPKADPKTTAGQASLALAMRMDWTLRSPIASAEFYARHLATLKPSAWPGSAPGATTPSLFPALNAARALAREKKWDEAANAYANAWWEAGGSVPAAPVRVGAMAAEMALVAQQSPGAKDRLIGLRNEYARAMDVSDPRHVHEYLILCRVLGDHEHNLKFLDEATQGKGAAEFLPAADLVAYDWLLPRCNWNDPTEGVSYPGAWIAQVCRQCDKLAARKDAASWASAVEYGRWLARVEASRRAAWLLIAGKDEAATSLRDAAIKADTSPEMKRSIVAACLASGQKRPWMKDLLKGIDDAELLGELNK